MFFKRCQKLAQSSISEAPGVDMTIKSHKKKSLFCWRALKKWFKVQYWELLASAWRPKITKKITFFLKNCEKVVQSSISGAPGIDMTSTNHKKNHFFFQKKVWKITLKVRKRELLASVLRSKMPKKITFWTVWDFFFVNFRFFFSWEHPKNVQKNQRLFFLRKI